VSRRPWKYRTKSWDVRNGPRPGALPLFAALTVAPTELPVPPPTGDPIELVWEAPPACPDAEAVRARIDHVVPEPGPGVRVRAEAHVLEEADTFALQLRIDDGMRTETREVRSRDCDALARATGLVIAVAIDPVQVARSPQVASPTVAPEIEPPAVLDPSPLAVPDRPAPRSRVDTPRAEAPERDRQELPVRFGLRPELLVGGGLLPGVVGLGVAGTFAVLGRARPWRAELGGAYWFPRRATIADTPTAGGDIWLAHARATGCGVPSLPRVEFPICAGLDVGAAGGRGFGEGVVTRTDADLFVGLHAGVGAAWAPIPALALFARVEGVVALNRPAFMVEGVGTENVHRVGAAGAAGAFGLEVRFFR
jgi:hypothetical protein